MRCFDFGNNGRKLLPARLVKAVIQINPLIRAIGRNYHHIQLIDIVKFVGFGLCRTSHTGQLFVEPEVVLDGDRRDRLGLLIDDHVLLCFHRLVQTICPTTSRHGPSARLIHNHHFAFFNDVMAVLFIDAVGAEQLGDVVDALAGHIVVLLLLNLRLFLLFLGKGSCSDQYRGNG